MKTEVFKKVRDGVAVRRGQTAAELQQVDFAAVTEYINTRVREGWDTFPWPECNPTEARTFRAPYDGTAAYEEGDEVYYEDAYYVATEATTGNLPTDEDFWSEVAEIDSFIALEQAWEASVIDQVAGVWDADPREDDRARELVWWLSDRGIEFHASVPARVWVKFSLPVPEFSAESYDQAKGYEAGDTVYVAAVGECYRARVASTGNLPQQSPDQWSKVGFPYVLATFVKLAAASDSLAESEPDKATGYERRAYGALDNEIFKVAVRQQGRVDRYTVNGR